MAFIGVGLGAVGVWQFYPLLMNWQRTQADLAESVASYYDQQLVSLSLTDRDDNTIVRCFAPAQKLPTLQLHNYRVAHAAWQNYLQCQNDAQPAVANCNFAELQEPKTL